jgi:hypothetical protein
MVWLIGWNPPKCGLPLEEALYVIDHFRRRARQMHYPTQFAAISDPMGKPAGELLHFSHGIGDVGVINLPVVARE